MNFRIIFVHSSGHSRSALPTVVGEDFCSSLSAPHTWLRQDPAKLCTCSTYSCLYLGDYGALGLQQPLHEDIKLCARSERDTNVQIYRSDPGISD